MQRVHGVLEECAVSSSALFSSEQDAQPIFVLPYPKIIESRIEDVLTIVEQERIKVRFI